jgi:hypothetical protein
MGKILLACTECEREDFDGVDEIPSDWRDVHEVQSYEESCREVDPRDYKASVFEWYTHLGICPECYQVEVERELNRPKNS